MKRYRVAICSLAVVSVLLVAGCSKSDSDTDKATTTVAGGGVKVTQATNATVVNMEVGDTKGVDGPMTMTVDKASVPAGQVKFVAKNTGTIVHEVIVLKTDTPVDQLKVNADGRVSEADSVGEISEFDAGTTSDVTLNLKPGKYVLVCNIKDHYTMGMRTGFTVT